MIDLPNGDDYGIAIKFGRYDKRKLDDLLSFIEDNYKGVEWWCGSNPTGEEFYAEYEDDIDNEMDVSFLFN